MTQPRLRRSVTLLIILALAFVPALVPSNRAESFSDWIKKDQNQMKDFHQRKEAPQKTQPKPEPPTRVEPKAEPTPKPTPQPIPEAKPAPETKPETKPVPAQEPEPEPKSEPVPTPETTPAPEPEPMPKPEQEAKPEAEPVPAPAPEPQAKAAAKPVAATQPNRYAVLIGISDYHSGTVPDLPHSATDVASIRKALIRTGYADGNIIVLTDDNATIGKVRKLLGTKVPVVVGENDSILVYFAGHGAAVRSARSTSADGTEKYLLFADSRIADLYGTALTMSELGRMFKRIRSNRLIVIMDTSYTSAMRPRGCAAEDLDDDFLDRLARKGSVILTAAKASEASLGSPALGHSLFSHHVAEMLSGAGDLTGDGVVTLDEGYKYLKDNVEADAARQGGSQHPMMKGELQGDFPLARIPE